ncbi:MAG: LamG domain-containing protein [bacterium]|nr:LamG domain-containing protein [bacterium]
MEIIIGLAVGIVLIGAGTLAISAMLRSHVTLQKSQSASAFAQGFIVTLPALARADWNSLAGLSRGSSSPYFLVASSTSLIPIPGGEGILDNDVMGGLVARWGFDEATGALAYDSLGHGNIGMLVSEPTRASSTCAVSGCLSFNGVNSYVNVPATSSLDISGPMTLAAWVKWNSFKNYGVVAQKASGGGVVTMDYALWSYVNNNIVGYIGNGVSSNAISFQSAAVLTTGVWHHLALVVDGATLGLYVDGIARATSSQTIVPAPNVSPFTISEPSYAINGSVDEVRLYNRALTSGEIQRLYAASPFTRSFYLETACRTTNASSAIAGVEPCVGGTAADPSTLSAIVQVTWPVGAAHGSAEARTYLIRGGNETFRQTDWSGGAGEADPIVTPGSRFATSTGADITGGGSIRIHGL